MISKTLVISSLVALFSLYIGLTAGYAIGKNTALKHEAWRIKQAHKVSKITGTSFYQCLTGDLP